MKQLKFSGSNLKALHDYLHSNYSGISYLEVGVEKPIDIFVSEQTGHSYSIFHLLADVHNIGCSIIYREENPTACDIYVVAAGGGYGLANVGGDKGRADIEKRVGKDISQHAEKTGLKELAEGVK